MRKMFLIMAVLLPVFALKVNADDKNVVQQIPIEKLTEIIGERSLRNDHLKAFYYGMLEGILTTVSEDLGEIMITVENCTTGEMWESSFDSSTTLTHVLQISGDSGIYRIHYKDGNDNEYEGAFILN